MREVLYRVIVASLLGACAERPGVDPPADATVHQSIVPLRFESEVVSIFQDSRGHRWFGSRNDGVARFDGERLTSFTVDDGLTDNQVRSIREDRSGLIWFECATGLVGYDGRTIIRHTERRYATPDAWQFAPGDLWFKGDEPTGFNGREGAPGVYRFDGRDLVYLTFTLPADREDDWRYSVTGIATGKGGRPWFATYAAVLGFDGESFTIIDDERLGLTEETGRLHVRCVFEDSRGRLWIGNNWIGVILIDNGEVVHFTRAHGLGRSDARSGGTADPRPGDAPPGTPSLHRVFAIGEDRDGNVWFGTVEQGAWRYDGESLRQFTEQDGLTSAGVMAISTDRDGELWVGGDGVFRFNGESFDRVH